MKTPRHSSARWMFALSCLFMLCTVSASAQNTAKVASISNTVYFILGAAIFLVSIFAFSVIRNASKVMNQYGQSVFDLDFPIFKRMTHSSMAVAIVMTLIIIWGIYKVLMYSV